MSAWRPALRMARRDLRRHKVRAVLTCLLVALPVVVATVAALIAHNDRWSYELEAERMFYGGDAIVRVGDHTEVKVAHALDGWPNPTRNAEKRDPDEVDVPSLLPEGTEIGWLPRDSQTAIANGGEARLVEIDFSSRLTDGLVEIPQGRAPEAPAEVAMLRGAAAELGFLEDGQLVPEARFELADGVALDVVGIAEMSTLLRGDVGLVLVAPPGSIAPRSHETDGSDEPPAYLLDLPPLSREETRTLVDDLAARGVALQPREVIEHPAAWRRGVDDGGSLGFEPLLVGGLCILVGLIEVVLIVGAAFSVAARRQVRALGLLATNGGAAPDIRRVLLAQGILLGVVSSVVGAAAGVASFLGAADFIESRFLTTSLHGREVPWWIVLTMAALGSVTSVVAALLPGWRMARLTPVDALSGRFPLQSGESRAHRPAFLLAGCGLALLAVGGWATSEAQRSYPNWLGAAVFVAGSGLVALVAGTVWATPYVVRRAADLGRHLPLSGRYAFRDAGRHRFRSAAAVMALMITVAGAVLAGFGIVSAERSRATAEGFAPGVLSIFIGSSDPERLATVRQTLEGLIEPEEIAASSTLHARGTDHSLLVTPIRDAVQVVDEASLQVLVDLDAEALRAFRDGGVVTTYDTAVRAGQVKLALSGGGQDPGKRWVLAGVHVQKRPGLTPYTQPTYVSPETAEALGMTAASAGAEMVVVNSEPVTSDDLDRLNLHGFWAQSDDPVREVERAVSYGGVALAGLFAAIVVGMAVALAAAESRDDVATLAAVGAAPRTRRRFGAMHGLFLGAVGTALGVAVGVAAGLSFTQLDGAPGVAVPWLHLLGTVALVLPVSWLVGGIVTPSRFTLTRRTA